MKKNLVLVALLLVPVMGYGELFLEITKGSEDPYKVAMIPFEGNSKVSTVSYTHLTLPTIA